MTGDVRRPPWSEFRAALERVGFRPTKARGQNFLLDENLVRALVKDSGIRAGDRVLEIGAGCGFLSLQLAASDVELLCVEIDARLAAVARELVGETSGVRFLVTDALANKHALAPALTHELEAWDEPWHVVANLPYSISGPVTLLLSRLARPPQSLSLLLQREVAERFCAQPGEAAWGGLSAKLAYGYRARLGRRVPASAFWPRPRVESQVARLERTSPPEVAWEAFEQLTNLLFRHRRRSLGRALGELVGRERAADELATAGIEGRRRAETLELSELAGLARNLAPELVRADTPGRGGPNAS